METSNNSKLSAYMREKQKKIVKEQKMLQINNGKTTFYIKDALPASLSLKSVASKLQSALPPTMFRNLDVIYIGQFDELKQRQVESAYIDGAIYITNKQENVEKMVATLVHETAHSVEEANKQAIYGDGRIRREYLGKKERLLNDVRANGLYVDKEWYNEIEYDSEFDSFLFHDVGYGKLGTLADGLFLSPYAITSLREYFASAFEEYFTGQTHNLKQTCPVVYQIIDNLY